MTRVSARVSATFVSLRYKEVPWLEELIDNDEPDWRVTALRGCTPPGVSFVTAMAFIATMCFRTKRDPPWQRHPNTRLPVAEYLELRKQLRTPHVPSEDETAFAPPPRPPQVKNVPTHAQRPQISTRKGRRDSGDLSRAPRSASSRLSPPPVFEGP